MRPSSSSRLSERSNCKFPSRRGCPVANHGRCKIRDPATKQARVLEVDLAAADEAAVVARVPARELKVVQVAELYPVVVAVAGEPKAVSAAAEARWDASQPAAKLASPAVRRTIADVADDPRHAEVRALVERRFLRKSADAGSRLPDSVGSWR